MHKYIYWPTFGRTHEAICRARFAPVNSTNKKVTAEEVVSGHPIRDTLDDNSTWRSQPKKNTKKCRNHWSVLVYLSLEDTAGIPVTLSGWFLNPFYLDKCFLQAMSSHKSPFFNIKLSFIVLKKYHNIIYIIDHYSLS